MKSKHGNHSKTTKPSKAKSESSAPPPDEQEQDFWNTPGAAARTLHFTGELLTDEQIDMSDLSASLGSPVPSSLPRMRETSSRAMQFTARELDSSNERVPPPREDPDSPEELAGANNEDLTVMLQKPPVDSSSKPVPSPPEPEPEPALAAPQKETSRREGKAKVTTELENIVV